MLVLLFGDIIFFKVVDLVLVVECCYDGIVIIVFYNFLNVEVSLIIEVDISLIGLVNVIKNGGMLSLLLYGYVFVESDQSLILV